MRNKVALILAILSALLVDKHPLIAIVVGFIGLGVVYWDDVKGRLFNKRGGD